MVGVVTFAKSHDAAPNAELRTRWRRARRLFFNIATRLEMDAAPGGKTVLGAIRYPAKIANWSSAAMRDPHQSRDATCYNLQSNQFSGRTADHFAYVERETGSVRTIYFDR